MADHATLRNPRQARQQHRFLEDLKKKGFQYKVGWPRAWAGACPGPGAVGARWVLGWVCRGEGARPVAVDAGRGVLGEEEGPMRLRPQVKEDQEKVFFGIRADKEVFDLYRTLLMEPEGPAPRVQLAGPMTVPAATR